MGRKWLLEGSRILCMLRRFVFVIPCTVLLAAAVVAQDNGELAKIKEKELEDVRQQINELKQSMDAAAQDRDRLAGELQEIETAIAEQRQRLREIEEQQTYTEQRKAELDADLGDREASLQQEIGQLSAQVRTAYMSGSQEKLKLLLNQRDPATLGRVMAYYRYLNDHRAANIDAVNEQIEKLAAVRAQIAAEAARLQSLADERYGQLGELNTSQERRTALLGKLKQRIADSGREVERLAAQERDLTRLIAELTSILSDYPITSEQPFTSHKGQLTWPVAGTLIHDFGQPRAGNNIRWNGVVLAAPPGREVRSVYHGRVAFADWLAGMGLLVIVDHGEGFMSLYGYNETILKNAGDWVAPGDVIATVGDSGGQAQPALYFELRRAGNPVNPRQWVTKRPGQ